MQIQVDPKTIKQTVDILYSRANQNKSLTLMPSQVVAIAFLVQQMDTAVQNLSFLAESGEEAANMLEAYINEYGAELYTELMNSVDAEVVYESEAESSGQDNEGFGLDPQASTFEEE